jgi:DNA processing protein
VKTLIHGLQGTPIGIVSGLAKGIDGLAHEAALDTGLYTVAVPGSGLDRSVLYPAQHRGLADRILNNGGALVSELSAHTRAAKWTFPKRNRLMAGISTATLLIEADQRSGTLITARLAADYNRDVLAVPGSIFAAQSTGTNQYISHGATPITSAADLLTQLALDTEMPRPSGTPSDEDPLITALLSATSEAVDLDTLAHTVDRPAHELMAPLTELELAGKIQCVNGRYQRII